MGVGVVVVGKGGGVALGGEMAAEKSSTPPSAVSASLTETLTNPFSNMKV